MTSPLLLAVESAMIIGAISAAFIVIVLNNSTRQNKPPTKD